MTLLIEEINDTEKIALDKNSWVYMHIEKFDKI